MHLHFTYQHQPNGDLGQGDILKRTPNLEGVLENIHPQYFRNKNNKYFIVLTQSCDLVRGRAGDACKASYITLAAVRPLSYFIERELETYRRSGFEAHKTPICTNKNGLKNFLERLFNNNESGYFYLHNEPTMGFSESCCAMLALSIPLRADLHYKDCLDARVLSLEGTFRDKLGWLVGQMYSRVGTQDWESGDLNELVTETVEKAAIWVDPKIFEKVKRATKIWEAAHPGESLAAESMFDLIGSLPSRSDETIKRLLEIVVEKESFQALYGGRALTQEELTRISNVLRNDPELSTLLKN